LGTALAGLGWINYPDTVKIADGGEKFARPGIPPVAALGQQPGLSISGETVKRFLRFRVADRTIEEAEID
jgi:hypothetical protein